MQRASTLRFASLVIALACVFFASPALACPLCRTELGEQVRGAIFGPDFSVHLLAVLSPFLLLAGLVIALHYAYPRDDAHSLTISAIDAEGEGSS